MTDDGLAGLFERAVQDLDPGVPEIVGRAERLGRRMRTRRRMWALGSCLALAALGAGTLAAAPPLARSPDTRATAGTTRAQARPKPARRGKQSGATSVSPQPTWVSPKSAAFRRVPAMPYQMPVPQMLRVLRKLLPAHATVSSVDLRSAQAGTLEIDYNDGHGAVDLQLSAFPGTAYGWATPTCPDPPPANKARRPRGALPVSCAIRKLPGGSVESDAVGGTDLFGFYDYEIYESRPDGTTVTIQVGNGTIRSRPHVDRARPPGSMAGWEAVADNPAWHVEPGWQQVLG